MRPLGIGVAAAGARLASVYLSLAWAAVAVAVGFAVPGVVSIDALEEAGPIEVSTIYLYLGVVLLVVVAGPASLSALDKAALAIVLLAFAAREADLHLVMFDMSILKSAFYLRFATPAQILAALGVLLPIALAAVWLAIRHGSRWRVAPARWPAAAVTVATFVVVMFSTKLLDRMPDTLVALGMGSVPTALRNVFFATEEILEMSLPLLAALAVVQGRAARACQTGPSANPSPAPPRHRPAPSARPASPAAVDSRPQRRASGPRRGRGR